MPYFSDLNEPITKEQYLKEEYEKLKAEIAEETYDPKNPSNSIDCKLVMGFTKANGDNISITMKYAKQDVSTANIKSLMEGIVANGSIFEKVPAAIKSAYIETTEKTAIDLS